MKSHEERACGTSLLHPACRPLFALSNPANQSRSFKGRTDIHLKDAAIVAAAAKGKAEYLATHDVKHLLNHATAIAEAYGITVLTPAELLRALTN
jgi:predicted nucleic acid-binding protein